ncbi:MAG TPA: hypothetical protein PLM16_01760 [Candidatus Woesebacteria bacterium]|nr:hypothetical protein [Candidatus Woesebacteria bacterium]
MNHKQVLISALIIATVGVGGYFGTQALFSDTETSTTANFTVGTMDLDVSGKNGTAFDSFLVQNIGADGTVEGGKTWTINNVGSLPGRLTFALQGLANYENGCNEPEALADTTCANPGTGEGELGNYLQTVVKLNDATIVTSNLADANGGSFESQWLANTTPGDRIIPPGGSATVTMNWAIDHDAYGNEIQSDNLDFDVVFTLEQVSPAK